MSDTRHKTVGVSLSPELRERAAERARGLGLSFSRYVALCVEAELNGRAPQLVLEGLLPAGGGDVGGGAGGVDLEEAVEAGSDYGAAKAQSIGFEDDIEDILKAEEVCYERFARVAHLRTDFLVRQVEAATGRERRVALECKASIRGRYTVALGQAMILQALPGLDAVVLCVPYRKNFDAHVLETFAAQGIPVATPDSLVGVLGEKLGGAPG